MKKRRRENKKGFGYKRKRGEVSFKKTFF